MRLILILALTALCAVTFGCTSETPKSDPADAGSNIAEAGEKPKAGAMPILTYINMEN